MEWDDVWGIDSQVTPELYRNGCIQSTLLLGDADLHLHRLPDPRHAPAAADLVPDPGVVVHVGASRLPVFDARLVTMVLKLKY